MPQGDWNDLSIFWLVLKHNLVENDWVEADDGYIGDDPEYVRCPGNAQYMEDKHWTSKRSKLRRRGETVNHRLKTFKVLQDRFCHDINKHSMWFRACAVFAQLSFDVGSKKLLEVPNCDQEWMDPMRAPFPDEDKEYKSSTSTVN